MILIVENTATIKLHYLSMHNNQYHRSSDFLTQEVLVPIIRIVVCQRENRSLCVVGLVFYHVIVLVLCFYHDQRHADDSGFLKSKQVSIVSKCNSN
jgi:hypothetical protein